MRISQLIARCPQRIKNFVPDSIKRVIAEWARKVDLPNPVYGIGRLEGHRALVGRRGPVKKRALVSYITHPFRLSRGDWRNIQFSNIGIARSMVRALNGLGYVVDVVDSDHMYEPIYRYDLFIAHGGINSEFIARRLTAKAVIIFFSPGPYWRFWNEQGMVRLDQLRRRREVILPAERVNGDEDWIVERAHAIIALGNDFIRETYRNVRSSGVYLLNNAVYHDSHFDRVKRDYNQARRRFLFFAGTGNVRKGLDLVLEAFRDIGAELFVCQRIQSPFEKVYREELRARSNIHLVGHIPMRSEVFYQVCDACGFLIYPSCADGSPGAVVECMHQGLIPIVSRETTIDVEGLGIMLKDCSVECIRETVENVRQSSKEWCSAMSRNARDASLTDYTEEAFCRRMASTIDEIVREWG